MLDREQDKLIFETLLPEAPPVKRTPEPAVTYAPGAYKKLRSSYNDPSQITDLNVAQFAAGWITDWIAKVQADEERKGGTVDVRGFENIFVGELIRLRDEELAATTPPDGFDQRAV